MVQVCISITNCCTYPQSIMVQSKKTKREEKEKFRKGCPYRMGVNILTSTRWFELQNQERSKDPEHTEFIYRIYHFKEITTSDLQRYNFLHASDFDLSQPGGSWHDAPYVVSTNRERYTLIHAGAQQFARAKNAVVVRWFSHHGSWQQRPADQFLPEVLQDPCFYEYFVTNALGYFKDEGVSKRLGLVNSLPFRYHSFVLDPEDNTVYHRMLEEAQPGQIITLPKPPLIVNIEIDKKTQEHFTEEQLRALRHRSVVSGRIVLPVSPGGTKEKENIPVPGGRGYEPSRVTIRNVFPLDPGFAMTVNKAEGRTMKRVILCLSYHSEAKTNWDRRGIYVAFSRVCRACDIRLLLHGRTNMEKWQSISYIVDLFKDPSTPAFFAGYGRNPHAPPNHNWKTETWNGCLAYEKYSKIA